MLLSLLFLGYSVSVVIARPARFFGVRPVAMLAAAARERQRVAAARLIKLKVVAVRDMRFKAHESLP
jgi:hypothetical protein